MSKEHSYIRMKRISFIKILPDSTNTNEPSGKITKAFKSF